MSGTLREIIFKPAESNVDTINTLLEEGITSEQEVVEAVLNSGTAKEMYLVCKYVNISGRSIGRIAHALCKLKNAKYIYLMAKEVKGAPIVELTKGIIATADKEYICKFAKDVKGCNLEKLATVIVSFKDPYYILEFAIHAKGINYEKLEDALIEIGASLYIYEFACYVSVSNKEKLAKGMLQATEAREIFYYLRDFMGCLSDNTVALLVKRIIALKDSQWLYLTTNLSLPFGEGLEVEDLADGLIGATYDEVFYGLNIYLFARDYAGKGAPIEKLTMALINVRSFDCIMKLIMSVAEADAFMLIDFLVANLPPKDVLQCLYMLALENQYYSEYAVDKLIKIGDKRTMGNLISALMDDNIKLTRKLSDASSNKPKVQERGILAG